MSKFFFECLIDGNLYPDTFGIEVPQDALSDQAQAVLLNLLQEALPAHTSKAITVTVRDERGFPVYVTQALLNQHRVTVEPERK